MKNGFGHCSGCFQNSCDDCNIKYYDCHGFHYFDQHNCDLCLPKFGRIINDIYYCPRCAPESDEKDSDEYSDEYIFKNNIYCFEQDTRREIRKNEGKNGLPYNVITDEELNNPENWELYKTNPEHFHKLIIKRLHRS
jgi:hypothetical protein